MQKRRVSGVEQIKMYDFVDSANEFFKCTTLFTCKEIKLFAWNGKEANETLIVFTGNGDFIYSNLNIENPILRQIAWFKDPVHTPVSICFSPSGCFLLVVSQSCNLYILPVCFESHCSYYCKKTFNVNDLTIHTYPFTMRKTLRLTPMPDVPPDACNKLVPQHFSDNELILKEIRDMKNTVSASSVCWWHSQFASQHIGIIGTKTGEVIFIDLVTGIKVRETNLKQPIKELYVCQDNLDETGFLLITVDNDDQYKLPLNEKCLGSTVTDSWKSESRDAGGISLSRQGTSICNNSNSYSSRTRLQGLKQMSAVKLASLKHKIAETRSKITVKQEVFEPDSGGKISDIVPESIGSVIGETFLFPQRCNGENVLLGYYDHSQLLTIHSKNLELVPRSVHKMPVETGKVLLCNRVFGVVSKSGKSLLLISSELTETSIEESTTNFNSDAVLGKWCFEGGNGKSQSSQGTPRDQNSRNARIDGSSEIILNICKTVSKHRECDIEKIYNVGKPKDGFPELPLLENCVVITNRSVHLIHLRTNLLLIILNLILEAHELEKVERICIIFGINLQKLLELAGDIKLNSSEFPTAIALYKLSKCGLLRSIVKLACGSHCMQVLNYSLMLLANSASEMPLTEKIHLSNLIIMAYTQQILKTEKSQKMLEKFTEFLRTNSYFDEVLAVSVTGQSLLFSCLNKLIVEKGLIWDGYNVLLKLMERFSNSRTLDWCLNKEDFWYCATEPALIEAMVIGATSFCTYSNYMLEHLRELSSTNLKRLSKLLDPTAACLRSLARLHRNPMVPTYENDGPSSMFPFSKLVELFLITLLQKAYKNKKASNGDDTTFTLVAPVNTTMRTLVAHEGLDDSTSENEDMWPVKNQLKECNSWQYRQLEKKLSCGFGHTALVRNETVYTWGQTARGCLGRGPTMMRHSVPAPVSWLVNFRLQVSVVACGKNHTAALTNNGVYTWGCSKYGQLGLGDVEKCPHPRLVESLAKERVTFLICGQFHTLALTLEGSVFAWGWGVHGQLGLGTTDDYRIPQYVHTLKEHVIVDVAAGHGHSVVLSDAGHVYTFGSGVFGQLGTGTTVKHSSPVIVKGFHGRVTAVATGYFQNLALTEFNSLYAWGLSPQCLRFQAQARKKSKLQPCQPCGSDSEPLKSSVREENESLDSSARNERDFSEQHLSPSQVDTSNVNGKIVQISCGCHHSALVTDSGGLYVWGRSLDGQLGAGALREIQTPTQIAEKTLTVDQVSCGCEFTVAQEKQTGKIYAWGSNAVGQLALPVRESATKALDGKLVMLKSCKRIVRLLDRNTASNSSDVPKEILEIPPPAFTYHTLSKYQDHDFPTLTVVDPDYSNKSMNLILDNFSHCIDMNLLLNKSLEYENFHVASKIALLQNNYKQSMIYQLKELQRLHKCREQAPPYIPKTAHQCIGEPPESSKNSGAFTSEYVLLAQHIIGSYLGLDRDRACGQRDARFIIETAIQFWTAEKLAMASLETFFNDSLNENLHDLAHLLFCMRKNTTILSLFSTKFLIKLTTKVLQLVKNNEENADYVVAMSDMLAREDEESRSSFSGAETTERRLEIIEEQLRSSRGHVNHLKISGEELTANKVYFFTCGHHHTSRSLDEFLHLDVNQESRFTSNLVKIYQEMNQNKRCDLACPKCVKT